MQSRIRRSEEYSRWLMIYTSGDDIHGVAVMICTFGDDIQASPDGMKERVNE